MFACCVVTSLAYAAPALQISGDRDIYQLHRHLEHFEDSTGRASLEAVTEAHFALMPAEFRLGATEASHWFRFKLRNISGRAQALLLHVEPWQTREATLYVPSPSGSGYERITGGYAMAPEDVSQPRWQLALEFTLAKASAPASYYLRIKPDSALNAPRLSLWRPAAFGHATERDQLVFGGLLGALFVMFAYNFFLYIGTRDVSFLYYVAYVATMTMSTFIVLGFAHTYLPASIDGSTYRQMLYVASNVAGFFGLQFCRTVLGTPQLLPRWDRILAVIAKLALVYAAVSVTLEVERAADYSRLINLAFMFVGLGTGIAALARGSRAARYFVLGWSVFFIGGALNRLAYLQVIPANDLTLRLAFAGLLFEVVLFSFSLADRLNRLRKEKEDTQNDLLKAQQAINRELEHEVQARTHELVAANEALQRLSGEDALTGIHNRRHLDDRLRSEWNRLQRDGQPLAFILCDIDHFKQFNDNYGHQRGDDCLRAVGQCLAGSVQREADDVARYGGEEFAVLLPDTDVHGARLFADALRAAVEALRIEHKLNDKIGVVTISVGVASIIPSADVSAAALIGAADRALYASKAAGRNCVTVSEE